MRIPGRLLVVGAALLPAAIFGSVPNILFILADDLGWQDTSVTLGPSRTRVSAHYRTPAIERLAREGMRFSQAYACAVCSPSRVGGGSV